MNNRLKTIVDLERYPIQDLNSPVMGDVNSDEILMTGHTIHAFTNLNSRPIKVPDYIKSLLERHMNS